MKTFIVKNTEGIILGTVLTLLVGVIVFNIITHGIYDTPSFEF
jgi:hypothetical protein|tara:strand:- start:56 stop:184 length:129 start_codon:yes stop_codon:yes gene_type:complete